MEADETHDDPNPSDGPGRPRDASRVLLVDDEDAVRRVLSRGLQRLGYAVDAVATVAEAKPRLRRGGYDLVITDVRLGDGFGTEAVAEALPPGAAPAVLIVSGSSDQEAAVARRRLPARVPSAFLAKPFSLAQLQAILADLVGGDATEVGGA